MNLKETLKNLTIIENHPSPHPFEHRIFITVLLFICSTGVLLLSYDLFLGNLTSRLLDLTCIIYSLSIYLYSQKHKEYNKLIIITFTFLYVIISLSWFFNNGIHGASPFFFIILSCYSGVFFKNPLNNAIPFIIITVSTLTIIEYLHPNLITVYTSKINEFIDIGASIIICLLIIGVSIHIIYKRYDIERELNKKMLNQAIIDKKLIEKSINEIQILQGLLPICSHCKKIKDETGNWEQLERFIQENSEAEFSHSLCPECAQIFYPEFSDKMNFIKKNLTK